MVNKWLTLISHPKADMPTLMSAFGGKADIICRRGFGCF